MIILSVLESAFYIVSGVLWLALATSLIEGIKPKSWVSRLILATLIVSSFLAVLFCGYLTSVAWHA